MASAGAPDAGSAQVDRNALMALPSTSSVTVAAWALGAPLARAASTVSTVWSASQDALETIKVTVALLPAWSLTLLTVTAGLFLLMIPVRLSSNWAAVLPPPLAAVSLAIFDMAA